MKKRKFLQNLMYVPAVGLMFAFIIYPLIKGFGYSFYKWNGYSQNMTFIGLENYLDIFRDQFFGIAFGNTILYALLSTILQEGLGLAFALFLNSKFKGRTIVRTIIYLPMIISALLVGYIMMFFFQYHYGVINEVLQWLGMEPIDWLRDPVRGRLIISLVTGWHYSGSSMIIFMAGLQNIPSRWTEDLRFYYFIDKRWACPENKFIINTDFLCIFHFRKGWIRLCHRDISVCVYFCSFIFN